MGNPSIAVKLSLALLLWKTCQPLGFLHSSSVCQNRPLKSTICIWSLSICIWFCVRLESPNFNLNFSTKTFFPERWAQKPWRTKPFGGHFKRVARQTGESGTLKGRPRKGLQSGEWETGCHSAEGSASCSGPCFSFPVLCFSVTPVIDCGSRGPSGVNTLQVSSLSWHERWRWWAGATEPHS